MWLLFWANPAQVCSSNCDFSEYTARNPVLKAVKHVSLNRAEQIQGKTVHKHSLEAFVMDIICFRQDTCGEHSMERSIQKRAGQKLKGDSHHARSILFFVWFRSRLNWKKQTNTCWTDQYFWLPDKSFISEALKQVLCFYSFKKKKKCLGHWNFPLTFSCCFPLLRGMLVLSSSDVQFLH